MSKLQIDLPEDLRAEIARRVGGDVDAEAAWVATAVRERLTAVSELESLEVRAARGSRAAFERVMAKVPDIAPVPGDDR